MWALLLPLPWFLLGVFAAGRWRRGKPGCVCAGGLFVWPQAALLERLGIGLAAAWGVSLGLMIVCPVIGYLVGLRLFPPREEGRPPET